MDGFIILFVISLFLGFVYLIAWATHQFGWWVFFLAMGSVWVIQMLKKEWDKEKEYQNSLKNNNVVISQNNSNNSNYKGVNTSNSKQVTLTPKSSFDENNQDNQITSNLSSNNNTTIKNETRKRYKKRKKKKRRNINKYERFVVSFNYVTKTYGFDLINERRILYFLNDFHAFTENNFLKDLFYRLYDDGIIAEMMETEIDISDISQKYSMLFSLKYHDVYDFLKVMKELLRSKGISNVN